METVLLVFYLLVAIFLVAVILMQRSSGGALNGLGGDGTSSIFTARGTGNFLTKLTAILATLFFLSAIALSLLYKTATPKQVSILETSSQQAPAAPAETEAPSVPSAPVAGE